MAERIDSHSDANAATRKRSKGRSMKMLATKNVAKKRQTIYSINASESPLLQLPPELRNRIWRFVLGGQTLYVHKINEWTPYHASICKARFDDYAEALRIKSSSNEAHTTYKHRHRRCDAHNTDSTTKCIRYLNTSILLVCREIHAEAALIPFEDNTFVSSMQDVAPFLKQLVPSQARTIKSMVVVLEGHSNAAYATGLITKKLTSLEHLTCFVEFGPHRIPLADSNNSYGANVPSLTQRLAQFNKTPIKRVVVAAYKVRCFEHSQHHSRAHLRLLEPKQLDDWASSVERELLLPDEARQQARQQSRKDKQDKKREENKAKVELKVARAKAVLAEADLDRTVARGGVLRALK